MFNPDVILSALFNSVRSKRELNKNAYMAKIERPFQHSVKEQKWYSSDELAPLNGNEQTYLATALSKDDVLKPFDVKYMPLQKAGRTTDNYFTILRYKDKVNVNIVIFVKGEKADPPVDEIYAKRMRYILNLLPFMADV